jgi:diaminopimelate decarboxylase
VQEATANAGMPIVALHAHVGTGPQPGEFEENMRKLVALFAEIIPRFPDANAANLGGGVPHPYRKDGNRLDFDAFRKVLIEGRDALAAAAGRPIRVEIEPGRYAVAGMGLVVARVTDVKRTRSKEKGPGHEFIMVDAGFNDLVRPAMYGSFHEISIVGAGATRTPEPFAVAGPLCESGDVFTRDDQELLQPRMLGRPDPGDLLVLHDAGAYGAAMSSNYVSLGRAPQVSWEDGKATLIARRETLADLVRTECEEAL